MFTSLALFSPLLIGPSEKKGRDTHTHTGSQTATYTLRRQVHPQKHTDTNTQSGSDFK